MWVLCKLTAATMDGLSTMRMAGRLVYMPCAPRTAYCHTLRRQKASSGIMKMLNNGQLFYNAGDTRPDTGGKIDGHL